MPVVEVCSGVFRCVQVFHKSLLSLCVPARPRPVETAVIQLTGTEWRVNDVISFPLQMSLC